MISFDCPLSALPSGKFRTNPGWLCCAAGVCESSLVVCAHEHGAIIVGAGGKRDICHFQQGVGRNLICDGFLYFAAVNLSGE